MPSTRAFERLFADGTIPGMAYGVVIAGDLVHARGLGTLHHGEDRVPDADSVFRIASMTKSFTASAVLLLRDEGALRLDEPVGTYVPELAGFRGATADSPLITVRHLLTMSGGLPTDDPWGDRLQGLPLDAFAELLGGGFTFAWPPGTAFEYSNLGYGILGRVLTNVSGQEYRDLIRDRLLDPARDGCHGLRGRRGSRCPARPGTRTPRCRLRRRAVRSLRRAGVDGRGVQLRSRPHHVGARVRRGVPRSRRPRGVASVIAGLPSRDAAGAARLRSRTRVDVGRSCALAAGRWLRVRIVRLPGPRRWGVWWTTAVAIRGSVRTCAGTPRRASA